MSGSVSTEMGDRVWVPGAGHLSRYATSQPGQLSLAIPSWVGATSIILACDGLHCTSLGREFHTDGETKQKDRLAKLDAT